MENGLNQIEELKSEIREYVKLRWAAMRLDAVEGISRTLSKAFGYVIFLALIFIALVFLMMALALWLGEILGHLSLGFLISGGAFVIAAIVIYFVHEKLGRNAIVRYFVDLFFSDNNNNHETQK
jgi:hypothetical protein